MREVKIFLGTIERVKDFVNAVTVWTVIWILFPEDM